MSGTVLIYDDAMTNIKFLYTAKDVVHLHGVYIGQASDDEDAQQELEALVYDKDGYIQLEEASRDEVADLIINGADLILCGCL